MKFLLDTNVYIHFNLFTDCDWKTLLGSDDLTLLVTPTILEEIDKLKNDPKGFVNRRAREIGSKFDEIDDGKSIGSGIKVDFPEHSTKNFEWDSHNLDKSRSDDQIIAEILIIKESCGDEVCIVTEDSLLKRKARAHHIKFVPPSESWRRDQKDPKDKKIRELEEFVKKSIPEVKLCLRNNGTIEECLAITIGDSKGIMLTNRIIEEKMSDLKRENIEKVEALRNAYGLFSEKKIDRYEKQLGKYLESKRKYYIDCRRVEEERSIILEIPLILKSIGNTPAEDIDVIIEFPEDMIPMQDLPEFPEEPIEPERPLTFSEEIEQMAHFTARIYPELPIMDLKREREPKCIGPKVDELKNRTTYWIKSLKHGFLFCLPLLAKFRQGRPAHTFQVSYRLSISNHPKWIEGRLTIKIESKKDLNASI